MFKPTAVKALPGYRLWIRYADGVEGEVDLSHLVGKGVFHSWEREGEFENVKIGSGSAIAWSDEVELCADSLYLQITGKTPDEAFSTLRATPAASCPDDRNLIELQELVSRH